jgi:hypothetical protein
MGNLKIRNASKSVRLRAASASIKYIFTLSTVHQYENIEINLTLKIVFKSSHDSHILVGAVSAYF